MPGFFSAAVYSSSTLNACMTVTLTVSSQTPIRPMKSGTSSVLVGAVGGIICLDANRPKNLIMDSLFKTFTKRPFKLGLLLVLVVHSDVVTSSWDQPNFHSHAPLYSTGYALCGLIYGQMELIRSH